MIEINKYNLKAGMILEEASISNESINGNLEGINFEGSSFRKVNFFDVNLKGANFKGAKFDKTSFYKSNLEGANFSEAYVNTETSFFEANLKGANLKDADFHGANLEGAYLGKPNLREIKANAEDFMGAIFEGPDGDYIAGKGKVE